MAQQLLVYVLIILLGGTLSLFLAVHALLRFKNAPGGGYYVLAALMASVLSFGYAFELTSANLEQIQFWIGVEYFALPFLPVFTLLMCFEYIGITLGPWQKRALFAIPALTFVFQHTNDFHHLYYATIGLQKGVPFPIVDLGHGPWYIVHVLYLYGCLAVSIALLLLQIRRTSGQFRLQMLAMTAGLLMPVAGNLYYLAGKSPYGIDLGPVFISLSFVFHSMAVFRFRMFNVAPIARDIVFDSMGDGVLVLGEQDVVVDYNRALLAFVPDLTKRRIGRPASEILAGQPLLAQSVSEGRECELQLGTEEDSKVLHLRFSPVHHRSGHRAGTIVTFVNITQRVEMEKELKRLAITDGLTGLLNKNALIERAEIALREAESGGSGVSVVMFDVDHFKKVNDTFGHEAGDLVLSEVAKLILRVLEPRDIAGRYGGDEFVLCLPDTSAREARERAGRIRAAAERLDLHLDGRAIRITSSFGVSHVRTPCIGEAVCMQTLMRRADKALYAAKQLGRNRVEMCALTTDAGEDAEAERLEGD
ncbi:histidine kinase N-terminal 7TM domain-containing protein [Saccharibacillus sp. CPCC 101409]|uniref:histidine kinase N-terminal 7TM domain-containing diguanylate cyclase n=1 Tax=Saccharibacillus sp. CPCC 101409 TaxID=3058041 RepID=UPI002670D47C|nr:histidine kinase N-terminal 7TM domain-containing protein [Saccharibacillus sp. CPCC 101409]MDO3409910.1 histidine kinase N-terminal 7TM domain-containing protein [Saccharibacillus sp. CPCC 101409]